MHIKRIHEMIESLTECTKEAIESDQTCVGSYPIGEVVDMIKDLAEPGFDKQVAASVDIAFRCTLEFVACIGFQYTDFHT